MAIKRLVGPKTHVCWTPDHTPVSQRERVSLVREDDLVKLDFLADKVIKWLGEDRMELVRRERAGETHIGMLAEPMWLELMNAAYDVRELR